MDAATDAAGGFPREADGARTAVLVGLAGKAAEVVSLAFLVAVVPRVLGPVDYGVFAVGLSVVTIGSAALSFGAAAMLVRFVPAVPEPERAQLARAVAHRIARRRLVQIAVIAIIGAILVSAAPGTFPALATTLVVAALTLDLATTLCFQLALGLGRVHFWSFRYPLQNTFLTAATLVLGSVAGVNGALAALVLSSSITLGVGVVALRGNIRGPRLDRPVPDALWRFGLVHGLGSVLFLATHRSGIVIAALLTTARETGFAALAVGVALAALYSVWQISTLQLATQSRYADARLVDAERQARRFAAQALSILTLPAVVGALFLESLLVFAFGDEFRGAKAAFIPVLALLPLIPLTGLANQIAALRVKSEARLLVSAVGLVVFAVSAPVCAFEWGATGITAALLASTLAVVLVAVRVLPRMADRSLLASSLAVSALSLTTPLIA